MVRKLREFLERRTRYAWSTALMIAGVAAVVLTLVSLPRVDIIFVLMSALVFGGAIGLFLDWKAYRRRRDLSREWEWLAGARVAVYEGIALVIRLGRDGRYRCEMSVGGRLTTWPVGYAETEEQARAYLVAVATVMLEEAEQNGVEFL